MVRGVEKPFLSKGADPRIANNYGNSPLEVLLGIKGSIGALVAERFLPRLG
jgi:hypothetical protein